MRIQKARLLPYRLPLRAAWRTRRGALRVRRGWLVELGLADGRRGLGDCAPLPAAGTEAADDAEQWLRERLDDCPGREAQAVLTGLEAPGSHPAARHALESALLDLLTRTAGIGLRHWLNPRAGDSIAVNAAAGRLDARTGERCQSLHEQGFRVCKLKVGVGPLADEMGWLQRFAGRLPERMRLRLDANGAWEPAAASDFLRAIAGLPVESLEEPLADPDPGRLAALQDQTPISLALDESLPGLSPDRLWKEGYVRRIVIKPTVLGGVIPAYRLARQAQQAGLETLVTSTLESAVGLHAAAQLAAALELPDRPLSHGLATARWFSEDVAVPPTLHQGRIQLPANPGMGVTTDYQANGERKSWTG